LGGCVPLPAGRPIDMFTPAILILAIATSAQAPFDQRENPEAVTEAAPPCVTSSATSPVYSPTAWQVVPDSNFPAGVVGPAMAGWDSSSCNTGGTAFPQFTTSPIAGSKPVPLHYVDGLNPANNRSCGNTDPAKGVTLFSQARMPNGTLTTCGPIATQIQNLEHEFGHKLTLNDSSCSGYIMSNVAFPPQTGTTPPPPLPRAIQDAECAQANTSNITPSEQPPPVFTCAGYAGSPPGTRSS
jgi:hypothetical protein